jgi:hypothetical protein
VDKRFPASGLLLELDRIDRSETLDTLLVAVLEAGSAEEVRTAILSASRLN